MNNNPVTVATVMRLIRHRWRVLAALAVVGAIVGLATSLFLSPGYASSTKVLLQGSREKTALPGEAQIATSLVVLDRTAAGLDWGITGNDLRDVVAATVLDGNVIQIRTTASTPERAQQLADRATREYITFSTQIVSDAAAAFADVSNHSRDAVQQRMDEAQRRIDQLQASPLLAAQDAEGIKARDELERARATVDEGTKDLENIDAKKQNTQIEDSIGASSIRVIEPAVVPVGPASPTLIELIVGGALLFAVLGVFGHLVAMRADRRLQEAPEIAAALGAPVLATVEVRGQRRRSGRFSFLHDDRRWATMDLPVSDDDRSRGSRYRRLLGRLRPGSGPLRLLVLVPHDDPDARSAVVDMAVAAATGGRTASVSTDDAALADAVRTAAQRHDVVDDLTVGSGESQTDTALQVLEIVAARPSVPDAEHEADAVLAISAGTRTGWELAGIAGACTEAGRRLVGVMVATPRFVDGDGGRHPTAPDVPEAAPADSPVVPA